MDIRSFLQKKLIKSSVSSIYLLPNYFKKIGWSILILSLVILIVTIISKYFSDNTVIGIIWQYIYLISVFLIAFSREKTEDEFIEKLRLKSYLYSTLIAIIFFLFTPFFTYILVVTSLEIDPLVEHLKSEESYDLLKSYHTISLLVILQQTVFDILKKLAND